MSIAAVQPGRFRALRLRTAARRLPTSPTRRRDLEPDLAWSGFQATLRAGDLLERTGGGDHERWDVFAHVLAGRVHRRRARFEMAGSGTIATIDVPETGDVLMRATATADGALRIDVHRRWLRIERHRVVPGAFVEFSGAARLAPDGEPRLELTRASDRLTVAFALTTNGTTGGARSASGCPFTGRHHGPYDARRVPDEGAEWHLAGVTGNRRVPVALDEQLDGAAWRTGSCDISLGRQADGGVSLLERQSLPAPRERRPQQEPADQKAFAPVLGRFFRA